MYFFTAVPNLNCSFLSCTKDGDFKAAWLMSNDTGTNQNSMPFLKMCIKGNILLHHLVIWQEISLKKGRQFCITFFSEFSVKWTNDFVKSFLYQVSSMVVALSATCILVVTSKSFRFMEVEKFSGPFETVLLSH